jgi:GNAT superfamily N-acetyltransferase
MVMDMPTRRSSDLYVVVCRPGLPRDKDDVLALTRDIWDGNDYVPDVWDDWLADPEGLLAVAEYGGRVVGLVKLSRKGSWDWWLEGLRVHPLYQGRGIASHMHDYILDYWQRELGGVIRLATSSARVPVHRLCQRTGFELEGEYRLFAAPSLSGGQPVLRPIQADEAARAVEYLLDSPLFALCSRLVYLDWCWGSLTPERLAEIIQREHAFWWLGEDGGVNGLLGIAVDEDDEAGQHPFIQVLGCKEQDLPELLLAYRRLAGQMGFDRVEWLAPDQETVKRFLQGAGYQSDWENSLYLFEKRE